jgi:hypothetical protein
MKIGAMQIMPSGTIAKYRKHYVNHLFISSSALLIERAKTCSTVR